MTTALFFHAHPVVRERYESALGCSITFVNSKTSQLSAGYDERTGIAKDPLPVVLAKHAPDWRAPEPLVLLGFSAGCWAVRHFLRDAQNRRDVAAAVLIDGLHGESAASLGGVLEYARLCIREPRRHRLVVTNSDIDPVTYASTDDAAAWLHSELDVGSARLDHWSKAGAVFCVDDPGRHVDAAGHRDQLLTHGVDACAEHVRPFLDALRDTEPAPPVHPDALDGTPWRNPSLTLGERCVLLSLAEMDRENPPSSATVAKYLSGCVRGGKRLGLAKGNHCSAAGGWALEECLFAGESRPHAWRAGAKENIADAIAAGCWHPVEEIRSGKWMPSRGDVVIYDRSQPGSPETAWWGHYDRILACAADGYDNLGANEGPRGEWRTQFTPWSLDRIEGVIAYPRKAPQPAHPVPEELRRRAIALRDLTLAQTIAEAPWRDWR